MTKPRILVFGYHEVGYECLHELITRGQNVVAVFTHTDNPREEIWFRSAAELAARHAIPVYTPETVNTPEWIGRIPDLQPDLIFSFYYRTIIGREILALPRLGAFNMHGSLLPKYRGRVPINWAIIHGETETGATLHHMVARPDAGDIVDQEAVPIGPEETAHQVFLKVTATARRILARRLDNLLHGTILRIPQDESRATYFGGRKPEDGRIAWGQDAHAIFNLIRAVTHPYPGAYTEVDGRRLFIWWALPREAAGGLPGEVLSTAPLRIATGNGSLQIEALQWAGEAEQQASIGGHGLHAGQIIGAVMASNTAMGGRHES